MGAVRAVRAIPALLWFWLFATLPRLATFFGAGSMGTAAGETGGLVSGLAALGLGLLHDALPVGLAIGAVQLWSWLRRSAPAEVRGQAPRNRGGFGGALLALGLALVLAALFADSRFFRYFGFHSNLDHLRLLGDWQAIAPSIVHYLRQPVVWLGLTLPPLAYLATTLATADRWRRGRLARHFEPPRGFMLSGAALAAGAVATMVAFPGPAIRNLAESWLVAAAHASLATEAPPRATAGEADLASWLRTAPLPRPAEPEPPWSYPDPRRPLIKATEHHLCRLGMASTERCAVDGDGDGYPLLDDCNDRAAAIHPGAVDRPRNGIDEDCSGLDAEPPSFLFIHWEGARAVNVGSLGYDQPSSPRFDALAERGVLFTNGYTNGTTTRSSLISVYASLLPRLSTRWIFAHNPELSLLGFPDLLRERGYHTIYLHGGYIGLGNKLPRFSRWFETRFDRTTPAIAAMPAAGWGLSDPDLFELAWQVLEARPDDRPFFLALATLSLHHPFELPPGAAALRDPEDPRHQISNLIAYSDQALGRFLERIFADPRYDDLAVVVWADHGVNWYAPHPQHEQNVLWEDLVWVPIALLGERWGQPPGRVEEVRQLADLGPTVLDLAGIDAPNPFVGQSLLRRHSPEHPAAAHFATANGGRSVGLRQGDDKYFVHLESGLERYFDFRHDRFESRNLAADPRYREKLDGYRRRLEEIYAANERLILENRVWSEEFRLPPG